MLNSIYNHQLGSYKQMILRAPTKWTLLDFRKQDEKALLPKPHNEQAYLVCFFNQYKERCLE